MRCLRLAVLISIAFYINVWATVINVPDERTTVQQGIDISSDGDTVLVQPGLYYEEVEFNGHNIVLASLFLTTGNESYIDSTIIDGNGEDRGIKFHDDEDSTAMVIGFTIQNCFDIGIDIISGKPVISNNLIWYTGPRSDACGIYCTEGAVPTIINNTITRNSANQIGGGIFCQGSSPIIVNNIISENTVGWHGGGILLMANARPIINNNSIINNSASWGGGIAINHCSTATVTNNTISGNSASSAGGGIWMDYSFAVIDNNTISDNSASYAAGIYCNESSPEITNNTISGNIAVGGAGGIACGIYANPYIANNTISGNIAGTDCGGILCGYFSDATIENNQIIGNSSSRNGGGIYCSESYPVISFNTIIDNIANENGGGIYCTERAVPTIINNTISGNSSILEGGGIGCVDSSHAVITNTILWDNISDLGSNEIYSLDSSPIVTYCDIEGGWPGEGNLDCDPMFCNPSEGNYELDLLSCCVEAGEGNMNIGAFGVGCEGLSYLPGDVNMYNGVWPPTVIGGDVTYLVNYFRGFQENPPCLIESFWLSADANGDCQVIGSDVTKLVTYFRGTTSLQYCPDYQPAWPTPDDLPAEAPEGWPNCE
ncbi:MAG: hypothetical protein GY839_12590 [candidate division Zixibacteria bacterium]|nr:hypothetical protein [candidate division Zixibacteria bacterium]